MAEPQPILVPDIGDLDKVDVVEVLVAAGDTVAPDDSLITLESDKATMDVPSTHGGVVREVKVKAGDAVSEGDLILTLEVEDASGDAEPADASVDTKRPPRGAAASVPPDESSPAEAAGAPAGRPGPSDTPPTEAAGVPAGRLGPPDTPPTEAAGASAGRPEPPADLSNVYASPSVRRLARELGVDLRQVRGSGRKGRVLAGDVQAWVNKTLSEPAARGAFALPDLPPVDFSRFGEIERQVLSRVQKISGPNLQRSWLHAPHVTQHDEADVTELEAFRQAHKARAKEEGFSLTPLAFVMKAVVAALREFPRLNASLDPDGEHVVLKKYYHLGIAVDTEDGLIVPVLRDVDKKGVFELARELGEVSAQARARKLRPDQLRGASFTISSLGGIGGTFFTPIINVPEVAILGVSRSRNQPVWMDGEFVPRLILPLSLSYDHRAIDGAMAVRFTTYLSEVLSDIRRLVL